MVWDADPIRGRLTEKILHCSHVPFGSGIYPFLSQQGRQIKTAQCLDGDLPPPVCVGLTTGLGESSCGQACLHIVKQSLRMEEGISDKNWITFVASCQRPKCAALPPIAATVGQTRPQFAPAGTIGHLGEPLSE